MRNHALLALNREADRALRGFGLAMEPITAPFPLWLLSVPDIVDPRLAASLSDAERERAGRFLREPLRRRYIAAHGALRVLGECYFGVAAADQRYDPNDLGKPYLSGVPGAQCSISYSGQSALIAWSQEYEIGVDLEVVRPIEDADDLSVLHYTQDEQAGLRGPECGPGSPICDRAFLSVWVRKEACIKALGAGLSIAPSSFDCGVGPGVRSVEIEGQFVECENYDLKDDLMVAWARLRRVASPGPSAYELYNWSY
ncbi:4'-phosphopantetheinyl transferase [Novosphingobium sp. PhB165]|uniref:4'-phosphopantetheinyl transferase family protein n=1 Tax=Novosphingobium sp. PhB165 TaxID=2485105 RepID=UPI0010ECE320|nr:4'-phosphopantetheinyl transferase superfamily protein [Novosphingobium sp. PhB165]TCM20813.1 4'-phosphopantetheinyl transferase [Novosphingobium sp. PhB165]